MRKRQKEKFETRWVSIFTPPLFSWVVGGQGRGGTRPYQTFAPVARPLLHWEKRKKLVGKAGKDLGWAQIMGKLAYLNFAVAIALLAGIIVLRIGQAPLLDSEKTFIAGLHNTLGHLDLAKYKWATEKNKSEQDIPTLEELMPYMKEGYRRGIERFMALGINYKITSTEEPQSDVATLTRDLRFRRGYCLFYSAGTTLCLHGGWVHSPHGNTSTHQTLYFKNNLDHLLEAALFLLVVSNVVVFLIKKKR